MKKDNRFKRFTLTALLSLLLQQGSALAMHGDELFLDELPVILTVTRLPQNVREIPAAVTVIDRELIEASGVVELTDLFRLVPGFQVAHSHGMEGPRTIVTSHGFSDQFSRRMQILIDGRSVYKSATGGPEWHDMPLSLDDIERIEVIRGPNAASYGANSMAGVINIITRHASDRPGSRITSTVGQRGYRQATLSYSEGHGNLHYRLSGGFVSHHGHQDRTGDDNLNDDMLTRHLSLRTDYRAGINDYLTLHLGGGNGMREVGWEGMLDNPQRDKRMDNHHLHLTWQRLLDTDSEIKVDLSQQRHRLRDQYRLFGDYDIGPPIGLALVEGDVDLGLSSERSNLEISHQFRLNDTTKLVWGIELREDRVKAANYFYPRGDYTTYTNNLFVNAEWRPAPAWVVNLGNMLEHNDLFGTQHSPRLGVNYLFADGHYLRGAVGRAYRMPTMLEEYADMRMCATAVLAPQFGDCYLFFTSPDKLQPERMDSIELGLGMEQERVGYDLRLFHYDYRQTITTAFSDISDYGQVLWNVGRMHIQGLEGQLRLRPDPRTTLYLAYAYTHADGWRYYTDDPAYPEQHKDISNSVPEQTLSVLFSHQPAPGKRIGVGYYHVTTMEFLGGNEHDGVDTIDISYDQSVRLGTIQGQWRLLWRDITGPYYTYNREVSRNRQAFLSLKMDF